MRLRGYLDATDARHRRRPAASPGTEDHLGFLECYAAASERCLERLLGRDLHSTYGPTADTGGLFQQGAPVIYRHRTVEELLLAAGGGAVESPRLPGPGSAPPAERGHRY